MAERGEAAEIVDAVMAHRPGLAERRFWKTPAAHAFLVGVAGEDRVGRVPLLGRQRSLPDRLALRPHDAVGPVLLQLLAVAAVEQRIVVAGRDFEDERQPFGGQRAFAPAKLASFRGHSFGSGISRLLDTPLRHGRHTMSERLLRGVAAFVARGLQERQSPAGVGRFCHTRHSRATKAGWLPGRPRYPEQGADEAPKGRQLDRSDNHMPGFPAPADGIEILGRGTRRPCG